MPLKYFGLKSYFISTPQIASNFYETGSPQLEKMHKFTIMLIFPHKIDLQYI